MSYMDMDNLYKAQEILAFKEVFAMEKIHGTSAHVSWKDGKVIFFSGGCPHENFVKLFDEEKLRACFEEMGRDSITIFGEAYGGKLQGMSATYGKELKFVAFEVRFGDHTFVNVTAAHDIATKFGLDFVDYRKVSTNLDVLDSERDRDSVQAVKNGCGEGKKREGIVLRPPFEVRLNNGKRVMAKHKREDFRETKTPRPLDAEKLKILNEAEEIAEEWVTDMRLTHVLDAFSEPSIEQMGDIIKAMVADVEKESVGETVMSKEARKAIGKKTVRLFTDRMKQSMRESAG